MAPTRRKPVDPAQQERDARAYELRQARLTYRQIAQELGCDVATAHLGVQRHAARIPPEDLSQIKAAFLEELDFMSRQLRTIAARKHYAYSVGGKLVLDAEGNPMIDDGPVMQAISGYRQIMAERAKVLGIYAPTKSRVEVITRDALMEAVEEFEAEIARKEAELARHVG